MRCGMDALPPTFGRSEILGSLRAGKSAEATAQRRLSLMLSGRSMRPSRETLHPLASGHRRCYRVIPCTRTAISVIATSGKFTGVSVLLVFPATDPVSTTDQAMIFVIEAGRI